MRCDDRYDTLILSQMYDIIIIVFVIGVLNLLALFLLFGLMPKRGVVSSPLVQPQLSVGTQTRGDGAGKWKPILSTVERISEGILWIALVRGRAHADRGHRRRQLHS